VWNWAIVTEQVTFKLQASSLYFGLSLIIHGFTFLSVWFYSFNFYASLIFSLALGIHFQYLNGHIFLKKTNSIRTLSLDGNTIVTIDNSGKERKYPYVYCAYQSRFLVIINIGERSLVIFKDSFASNSLSQLNRLLINART